MLVDSSAHEENTAKYNSNISIMSKMKDDLPATNGLTSDRYDVFDSTKYLMKKALGHQKPAAIQQDFKSLNANNHAII